MNKQILTNIGLSKNESKVYLALVKLGSASVNDIAKIADVHRVNIYDTLERLQEKGMIGSVEKANKKYFEAASPNILKELIEKKENEINDAKQNLPRILEMFENSKKRQDVHVFKGILGINTIFKDILESNPKEILDFGATKGAPVKMKEHMNIWHPQRIKKKIPMKILVSSGVKGELPKSKGVEYRYIDQIFNNLSSTLIYSSKVAILMWTQEPIAILIDSKELAESYENFFNSLWKMSKN